MYIQYIQYIPNFSITFAAVTNLVCLLLEIFTSIDYCQQDSGFRRTIACSKIRERERESIVACILGTYCAPKLMRGSHLLLVLFQTVTSQLQDAKSMVKFQMVNIDCNTSQ